MPGEPVVWHPIDRGLAQMRSFESEHSREAAEQPPQLGIAQGSDLGQQTLRGNVFSLTLNDDVKLAVATGIRSSICNAKSTDTNVRTQADRRDLIHEAAARIKRDRFPTFDAQARITVLAAQTGFDTDTMTIVRISPRQWLAARQMGQHARRNEMADAAIEVVGAQERFSDAKLGQPCLSCNTAHAQLAGDANLERPEALSCSGQALEETPEWK
jgi:hypothetical protein